MNIRSFAVNAVIFCTTLVLQAGSDAGPSNAIARIFQYNPSTKSFYTDLGFAPRGWYTHVDHAAEALEFAYNNLGLQGQKRIASRDKHYINKYCFHNGRLTLSEYHFQKLTQPTQNLLLQQLCGDFTKHTIADLRNFDANQEGPLAGHHATVTIVERESIQISQERHPSAVFQMASNFNCQEGGMDTLHLYLNDMAPHAVQGESGAFSAMGRPLTIRYRYALRDYYEKDKYGVHLNIPTARAFNAHDSEAVNLLEAVPSLTCRNGHVSTINFSDNLLQNIRDNYAIGYVKDALVTHGGDDTPVGTQGIRVDQILVSALNLNPIHRLPRVTPHGNGVSQTINVAQAILDALYEGTVRVAVAQRGDGVTLYLTLVGGYAFSNDLSWIAHSIERMRDFIIRHDMQIVVSLFDPSTEKAQAFKQRMIKLKADIQREQHQQPQ